MILGYTGFVLSTLPPESPHYQDLKEVDNAGAKAADLTHQLLAFSRQQVLEQVDLNLNDLIADLMKMLRRLLGEDIHLQIIQGHPLDAVRGDRGQLEQVVMNLCVNARDAMPDGGTITIETKQARFDPFICDKAPTSGNKNCILLKVSDTGHGMDEATQKHIFDPFFTTKEVGAGTGLGLATVYGIVKQHSGSVTVDSTEGRGTTIRVYLPATDTPISECVLDEEEAPPTGTETILLAEDEAAVLALTARVLREAGYTVLTASNGEEAITVFEEHIGHLDLAVLDVVMPHKHGVVVLDHIRAASPTTRFLFASGYSREITDNNIIHSKGVHLIPKPYNTNNLLRTVREILDEPQQKERYSPAPNEP